MQQRDEQTVVSKEKITAIIVVILLAIVPIGGFFIVGTIASGIAIGASATLQTLPVKCKPPLNIFDAWDSFEGYITGTDCNGECPVITEGSGDGKTSGTQAENVRTIIGVGKAMNVSEKGIVIALATALQESGLKNYANDGEYNIFKNPADSTLGSSSQAAAILAFSKKSLSYTHDAVGSDATSVGLFQQQAWWGTMGGSNWENDPDGTMKRLMDPAFGAQKFYDSLLKVSNWESMSYTQAADAVQRSAFSSAYQEKVNEAKALYSTYQSSAKSISLYDFGGRAGAEVAPVSSSGCSSSSSSTGMPLNKSAVYTINSPFAGFRGFDIHNGLDLGCRQYENVYSPISGIVTISIEGNASGTGDPAGKVYVKASDGTVFQFWHMRKTFVKAGAQIAGGQAIGECASTGNSTGVHLHITADITNSNNPQVKALPTPAVSGFPASMKLADPALALDILGVNICPPYVANRKTTSAGAPLPSYMVCWPQSEWK